MEDLKVITDDKGVLITPLKELPIDLLEQFQTAQDYDNLFKNGSWDIYYILLHCKIAESIFIKNDIEVIPFGEYSCDDYFAIVEEVIENIIGLPEFNGSKEWIDYQKLINKSFKKDNPLSLLVFRNINADTEFEVYEKTKAYAEDIMITISTLINSSTELVGWVAEGNNNNYRTVCPDILYYHYKQGYMDPKELEETINDILNEINENFLVKLVLKYENEALSERDQTFRLIKRWSALEFIAEYHSNSDPKNRKLSSDELDKITEFVMKEIIQDNNKEIKNHVRNRVGQINHKNVKDKIREFLSEYNYPIKTLPNKNKDILDLIYQKRNCITHNGGCRKDLEGKCEGSAYCRNSKMDLEGLNLELSNMLKQFIGNSVNTVFKYQTEISDEIKKEYNL